MGVCIGSTKRVVVVKKVQMVVVVVGSELGRHREIARSVMVRNGRASPGVVVNHTHTRARPVYLLFGRESESRRPRLRCKI